MPFCYYCGNKVGDNDVFCRECGKRVVSAVSARPVDEGPAEKQAPKKMAEPKEKVTPKEKLLTHKVYVLGDYRPRFLADSCKVTFTEGNGDVLYKARGNRETVSGGILLEDYTKTVYTIDNGTRANVAEVEVRYPTSTDDRQRIEFRKRFTPKPRKKGEAQSAEKPSRWFEPQEFESRDFSPELDFFGLSLLSNKSVMTSSPYQAESEGKLFSSVPARTDVSYKRAHVASIESEAEGYRIDYEAPEHVLEAVMIFLALYVRL